MEFDNSWEALLKPGLATSFFNLPDPVEFEPEVQESYSAKNAWWLAEICRLVYRQGTDEVKSASGPTRKEILKRVGFDEQFFPDRLAQCAIVKTLNGAKRPFQVLVFRGTHELVDWLTDIEICPVDGPTGGKVQKGFLTAFHAIWEQIEPVLNPQACPTFYTGHSLGASFATLAASIRAPSALYTYGSPRVGDEEFKATVSCKAYRVVNNRDVVTTTPPFEDYVHIGDLHYIQHEGQIVANPSEDEVARDRLKRDSFSLLSRDWHRHFTDAPEYLADHAPVNYVAHLERAL